MKAVVLLREKGKYRSVELYVDQKSHTAFASEKGSGEIKELTLEGRKSLFHYHLTSKRNK
jgi:hypothetical protein